MVAKDLETRSHPAPREAGATGGAVAGTDLTLLLLVPGALIVLLLFIYPFLYGLVLSFTPKAGGSFANYLKFFSDPAFFQTIGTTLWISVPATLINVGISVPIAFKLRRETRYQRLLLTVLVLPVTL